MSRGVIQLGMAETVQSGAAALEIDRVRYRYPGTREDVIDIGSLVVGAGEQVLLTGGSGMGKSTLLNLVAGLMDPDEGEIRVAGQAMHGVRGARRDRFRGRHVGMIFQTHQLLHGFTAAENVMAALMFSGVPKREHRGRAEKLLKHLGIERVDADPAQMSVGQQQRVAVARAVSCSPELVLADEPTSSLDPEAAHVAMGLIQEACRECGAALVCVSHDPSMAARFGRIEALEDVNKAASGAAGAPAGVAEGGA